MILFLREIFYLCWKCMFFYERFGVGCSDGNFFEEGVGVGRIVCIMSA